MQRRLTILLLLIVACQSGWHCKEVYNPPATQNNPDLLVVDGIVINGNTPTVITLSRTRNLNDSVPSTLELNAQVSVLGVSGVEYPLFPQGNGRYSIDQLLLDTTQLYQLKVVTADGNEFRSELNHVYTSPPIDSLNWSQNADGVDIFVNTHGTLNDSRYYRWQYLETWEYNSAYQSILEYVNDSLIIPRGIADQIYTCYSSLPSSSIEVASTTQLSTNTVSDYKLSSVPTGSEKISSLYSILVTQYGVTATAFNFWQNLKKNTEQLGSLFDLQPFTELGNIKCVSNPGVKCIGFISFSNAMQKRIFISKNQLNAWNYSPYYGGDCTISKATPDKLSYYFQPNGGPYSNSLIGGLTNDYIFSSGLCVDCRDHGGTTIKPSYWP